MNGQVKTSKNTPGAYSKHPPKASVSTTEEASEEDLSQQTDGVSSAPPPEKPKGKINSYSLTQALFSNARGASGFLNGLLLFLQRGILNLPKSASVSSFINNIEGSLQHLNHVHTFRIDSYDWEGCNKEEARKQAVEKLLLALEKALQGVVEAKLCALQPQYTETLLRAATSAIISATKSITHRRKLTKVELPEITEAALFGLRRCLRDAVNSLTQQNEMSGELEDKISAVLEKIRRIINLLPFVDTHDRNEQDSAIARAADAELSECKNALSRISASTTAAQDTLAVTEGIIFLIHHVLWSTIDHEPHEQQDNSLWREGPNLLVSSAIFHTYSCLCATIDKGEEEIEEITFVFEEGTAPQASDLEQTLKEALSSLLELKLATIAEEKSSSIKQNLEKACTALKDACVLCTTKHEKVIKLSDSSEALAKVMSSLSSTVESPLETELETEEEFQEREQEEEESSISFVRILRTIMGVVVLVWTTFLAFVLRLFTLFCKDTSTESTSLSTEHLSHQEAESGGSPTETQKKSTDTSAEWQDNYRAHEALEEETEPEGDLSGKLSGTTVSSAIGQGCNPSSKIF